jgi:hypothetical protein
MSDEQINDKQLIMTEQEQSDSPMTELGLSGLNRQGSWVNEEWLNELRGINGVKRYKEMRDNEAIVGAFLFAIEMLIRQASWNVEAGGDEDEDIEAAKFLKECLFEDMEQTWHELLTDAISMLPFGWAYHEMVFKKRLGDTGDSTTQSKFNDGRIGFRKIALRAQETFFRWEFAPNNDLLGMWQIAPPDYKLRFVPFSKSLLFRTRSHKNNPEGVSILRTAYRSYYFKKRIEEIEAIGIERDLAGLPIVTVPPQILDPNATPEEQSTLNALRKMVTQVRRDEAEGIVFPAAETPDGKKTGYEFKLLSSGSTRRQFDTNKIIERYEQRIAMTVLADFIFLGQSGVGSMALSVDKTKLFSAAIGTILDTICETLNSKAVPMLFKLNSFTGLTKLPKLIHEDIESIDVAVLGQFLNNISAAGASLFGTPENPNVELVNYLLKIANLPQMTEQQVKDSLAARKAKQQDVSAPQVQTQENKMPKEGEEP